MRPWEVILGYRRQAWEVGLSLWLNSLCRGWYGNAEFNQWRFTKGSAVAPVEDFLVSMWMFVLFCTSFMSCYICNRIVCIHTYLIYIYVYISSKFLNCDTRKAGCSSRMSPLQVTAAFEWKAQRDLELEALGVPGLYYLLAAWGIMKSPIFIGIPWNHYEPSNRMEWSIFVLFRCSFACQKISPWNAFDTNISFIPSFWAIPILLFFLLTYEWTNCWTESWTSFQRN